jgi:hypothetical protein
LLIKENCVKSAGVPLVISTLLPLALLGCQANSLNHSAQTSTVIDDKNWSATTPKTDCFKRSPTTTDWQLTHVVGDDKLIGLLFSH